MSKPKRRPPKKPSGVTGCLGIGGGKPPEFKPLEFPDTKRDIEKFVLDRAFLASGATGPDLRQLYRLSAKPLLNPDENGLDVILATESGEQYLELTEVAPMRGLGGSYERAPTSYVVGERADAVFDKLLIKSRGYGLSPRAVIHLLMYTTDFRYHLGSDVLKLLAYRAMRGELCFASILYYSPAAEGDDRAELVYPRPATEFDGFGEPAQRGPQIALGDITSMEAIPSSVKMKLGPLQPPGPGPVVIHIRVRAGP